MAARATGRSGGAEPTTASTPVHRTATLIHYCESFRVVGPRSQRSIDAWAGNVLRVVRAKTGLTQRQLAEKAGVPYSTIAKIESGTRQPTHPTMARILAAVDMSLATQLVPYDDHDDVLWEQEQRRSPVERAHIAAEQARLAREAK